MKLWRCEICGYVHEGNEAPDYCPKCNAAKEKFVELSQEDADKINKSNRTNDIHSELIVLANKIALLSEEGIRLNLDPGCVTVFEKAKNHAWIVKHMCKAELEGHMKKGKW